MGMYLLEATYSQSGIQGVMKEGATARKEFIEKMVANIGGSVEGFYFAFGDADAIVIAELPDEATAAAISMAVGASGGATLKTTVLLDASTVDAATQMTTGYRAPGA
jgi:uncharacterized protein with GYD domain